MKLIKNMNAIVKYQPGIVLALAGAYSGVVIAGRIFCKIDTKVAQELPLKYCYSNSLPCQNPQEASIPLVYVSSTTATTSSGTLSLSTVSFADAEDFNFPV